MKTVVACIGCILLSCGDSPHEEPQVQRACTAENACDGGGRSEAHDGGHDAPTQPDADASIGMDPDGGYSAATTWGAAQSVGNDRMGFARAAFAMNDAGVAYLVWVQGKEDLNQGVWANHYVPGTGWATPVFLGGPEMDTFGSVHVAVDKDGNAFAAWWVAAAVWACRHELSSGWSPPVAVGTTGDGDHLAIGVDGAGNAIATWRLLDQGIWSARYVPQSGWGAAVRVADTGTRIADDIALAVGEHGDAVMVWSLAEPAASATDPAHYDIWAARYRAGADWDDPTIIGDAAQGARGIDLATTKAGDTVVVWDRAEPMGTEIWTNTFDGSRWGITAHIDSYADPYNEPTQVAVNEDGQVLAAWVASDGDQRILWTKRYRPDTDWEPAERIADSSPSAFGVQVAMDEGGNALLLSWRDGTDAQNQTQHAIWADHYLEGRGWGTPTLLQTQAEGWAGPVGVAFDRSGKGLAAWTEWAESTSYSLWVRPFE